MVVMAVAQLDSLEVRMRSPFKSQSKQLWMIYGIIMAADLLLYFGIFYVGRVIPPAAGSSYPGNYPLVMGWLIIHFPSALLYFHGVLPERLLWLLVLQDIWLAAFLYLLIRRKNADT